MSFIRKFLNNKEEPVEQPPAVNRIEGKILTLHTKGYGFITSEEIEFERIFFHWTALVNDTLRFKQLREGMRVEFEPRNIPNRGWRAVRIKVLPRGN